MAALRDQDQTSSWFCAFSIKLTTPKCKANQHFEGVNCMVSFTFQWWLCVWPCEMMSVSDLVRYWWLKILVLAHTYQQMKAKARAGGSSFGSVYLCEKSKKYLVKVQSKWARAAASETAIATAAVTGDTKKASKSRGNCSKKHLTMPSKRKPASTSPDTDIQSNESQAQ